MMWERVLLVALAGAAGSVLRYSVAGFVGERLGPAVFGTFVVNVSGALLLGLLLGLTAERWLALALVRTAIVVGFLGAYTTFSTLAFETVDLAESGSLAAALLNVGGSLAIGLAAMYTGLTVGRAL